MDSVTDEESESDEAPKKRKLTMQEKAIYLESDALQIEMGNIVLKTGTGGAIIYDTARTNQHKDRYSALAMAVRYIAELEEARKRRLLQPAHPSRYKSTCAWKQVHLWNRQVSLSFNHSLAFS